MPCMTGRRCPTSSRGGARTTLPFMVSGLLAPILDADGHVTGALNNTRDVTEQLAAEQKVRDGARQLQAIIDNTQAAISVRDREFRYVLANDAFRSMVGLPPDSPLVGRPDSEVLAADAIARLRVFDHRVLAGESLSDEETVNRDGGQRFILTQRFPLTGADGRAYAIADVATDITDTKRAELELRERIAWEEHIREAVNEGRLLVYAQPIIDLATGALWGEELLVRMNGGQGPDDVVLPGEFLPQAERFGLMPIIDRFMIDQGGRTGRLRTQDHREHLRQLVPDPGVGRGDHRGLGGQAPSCSQPDLRDHRDRRPGLPRRCPDVLRPARRARAPDWRWTTSAPDTDPSPSCATSHCRPSRSIRASCGISPRTARTSGWFSSSSTSASCTASPRPPKASRTPSRWPCSANTEPTGPRATSSADQHR